MPVRSSRCFYCYAPLLVGLAALAIYAATMAPGLTWAHQGADGGDLVTAAYTLGIPHPSGYPLYVLLGWCFSRLPVGSIAFRLNLMSTLCAALSVTVFVAWVRAIMQRVFPHLSRAVATLVACAVGALLAFSRLFWSQALIAEVYALNALMTMLCLYWLQRWEKAPQAHRPVIMFALGLTSGLAVGNHLTILLLAPWLLYYLLSAAQRPGGREWTRALIGLALGLSVYALVPIRAAANPYVNWGDPDTLSRFWWLVSGALYQHYAFAIPLSHLPLRLASWAGDLVRQFGPWGVALGLLGLWTLSTHRRMLLMSVGAFSLYCIYAVGYNTADSFVYLIPGYLVWTLWSGLGALYILDWVRETRPGMQRALQLTLALICLMPMVSLLWNWEAMDLSDDIEAVTYPQTALGDLPPGAILISASDAHTFSLWYAQQVEGLRTDVLVIDRDLLPYSWYRENLFPRYPDVTPPKRGVGEPDWLLRLLDASMPSHRVYLTDADERLMAGYQAIPEGSVQELLRR